MIEFQQNGKSMELGIVFWPGFAGFCLLLRPHVEVVPSLLHEERLGQRGRPSPKDKDKEWRHLKDTLMIYLMDQIRFWLCSQGRINHKAD